MIADIPTDRALRPAALNGLRLRCPNCGLGHVLHGYLKVKDHCNVCGEDFSHQRADDGPAYLTVLLVVHIVGIALHAVYSRFDADPVWTAIFIGLGAGALSLVLLPRMKGLMIAIQWAKRMHGFGKPTASNQKGENQ